MIYEGNHDCPEFIDCGKVIKNGGRVKAGAIHEQELRMDYYRYGKGPTAASPGQSEPGVSDGIEIRVSIRCSKLPSIELFTLRNIKPADYKLVLLAIPNNAGSIDR